MRRRAIFAFCCITVTFIIYFLLNSTSFERTPPSMSLFVLKDKNTAFLFNTTFFNPSNDVLLSSFDSSGLAEYSICVTDKQGKVIIKKNEILLKNSKDLEIILPKLPNLANGEEIIYNVSVRDWSNTNFFKGNTTTLTKHLIVNNIPPQINVIALSERIAYGGSALIAFQIKNSIEHNNNIQYKKVLFNNGKDEFQAYPFINKHGKIIYLALVAWPLTSTYFEGEIHVLDESFNEQTLPITIPTNINYIKRKFNVNLDNKHFTRIWNQLKDNNVEMSPDLTANIDKFQFFNETIKRQENRKIMHFFQDVQFNTHTTIPRFNVFSPLENANTSGRFGDEFIYRHNQDNIGYSQRLGIDILNNQNAIIKNSNLGLLAFSGKLNVYGNLIAINHALGLTSIYGYLNKLPQLTNILQPFTAIGEVGQNHLTMVNGIYFGILVQGHFVNPQEWMNKDWIETNINKVLESANNFNQ